MPTEINCPKCSPLRIFLSYGHDANEELVRRIKTDLEKRGHDVWFDKSEIKFGDDWRHSITDGILKSNRVLSFLSKHSTRDPGVCIDEIGIAIGVKGGNVQTILVEGEAEVQSPPSISHLQWLDMHEWKDKQGVGETTWNTWYNEKFAEIVRVVESDESVRFAGEIENLMAKIKPVKSDTKMGELLRKPFTGRKWMHEAVEIWRNKRDDDSRLFWIVANPGVGKSAFVANLAHFGKARVIALHFCEWNKKSHKDPRQVVLNIAFQLACRLADYRKLLLTLSQIDSLAAKSETELFDYLLVDPLRSVIDGGRERYLVIIDALDEANADGRNAVAEMLAQHTRRLPEWLGFLITSRPEEEVMTPLRGLSGLKPFILDTARQENLDDIRSYLRHELPNASEAEIHAILSKSDGVFLYAEYVCEELRHNRLFLDRLDAFPHGLGGIYAQYFARQFPDLATYKRATRHVLGVLAAAREPLEPGFLAKIFGWDTYQQEDFLDSMGSLLRLSANTILPFHKSLFDWLADKSKSGNYFVSTGEGQKQLADHGMHEYRRSVQELSAYNLRHLPSHLTELERWDEAVELLCDLLFVEARCKAGQVFGLISDYRLARENLPEAKVDLAKQQAHDADARRWTGELIAYAQAWSNRWDSLSAAGARLLHSFSDGGTSLLSSPEPHLPAPPSACRIWTEAEIEAECDRILKKPTRRDRLDAFAGFVTGQCYPLDAHGNRPGFVLQHAFNAEPGGSVHDSAAVLIPVLRVPHYLRRWPPNALPNSKSALLRTLEGHSSSVESVSVTPDGRRAVSGSRDNTVRVWDLESGVCLRTLEGHRGVVSSVSVTPNGRRAVSGSDDNTVRVWDLESGACLRSLEGHSDYVMSVSVTPDGRRAVSGSDDGTVRVWDVESGACLRTLGGDGGGVSSVSVTLDGRRAVSGSECNTVLIRGFTVLVWDLESGACLRSLQHHSGWVNSVSVTPDGRRAVTGSSDKKVRVWDVESGAHLLTLEGHSSDVNSVSVTPDGRRAVSGSYDRTVRVWDLESGACLRTPEGHSCKVISVSVTPDGRRAVSGSEDNTVRVWDVESGACLRTLEGLDGGISSVSVTPDGRRAVSGSECNTVLIRGFTVLVWDLERGACLRSLQHHSGWVNSVSVTPDGRRAVTGSSDKKVWVWDVESGAHLLTLEGHSSDVNSVSVTPDGRRAVSGSDDWTVRVWDLERGACLRSLEGHRSRVISVSVTPDGRRAVSGSYDRTVRMWDLERGACLRTLEGHSGGVMSVSVTPDGRRAVSGSTDKTVRVWNLERGTCLAVYSADAAVYAAAVSFGKAVVGTRMGSVIFLDIRGVEVGPDLKPDTLPLPGDEGYERLLRRGLDFSRREKGPDHEETLAHLAALVMHLEKIGKCDEARAFTKERDEMAARKKELDGLH